MRKCVCDFNDATNTKEEIRKSLSLSGSMLAGIKSITTLHVDLYKLLIKVFRVVIISHAETFLQHFVENCLRASDGF